MEKKYIIAFEVSGSQIKGVLASSYLREDGTPGTPRIEAVVAQDQKSCVNYGRVQNVGETAEHVNRILEKLSGFPAISGDKITGCYVGNAGRSLLSEQITAAIDFPVSTEITAEMRDLLISEAMKKVPAGKELLQVIVRRYIVDNHVYPNPVGVLGRNFRGEFTIVKCNPENAQNLQMVFRDKVKLPVNKFIVTPIAVADVTLTNDEKQAGCILVDMGAQTTTVSVYKDNALQYLATLPIGSHNITRDLSMGLKFTEEKAEDAKFNSDVLTDSPRTNDNTPRVNSFVLARANEIIANILAQVKFGNFKLEDLTAGFILTGRGSKLKNFNKLLEQSSRLKVRMAKITAQLEIANTAGNIDPLDYLSVIAIAAKAASDPTSVSCVEKKRKDVVFEPPVPPQTPARETPQPPYNPGGTYRVPVDDGGNDWMNDDPVNKHEVQKAQTGRNREPAKEDTPKKKSKKESLLEKIQKKIGNIFETDENLGDAQL